MITDKQSKRHRWKIWRINSSFCIFYMWAMR